jgi:hypothetical protein
MNHLGDDELLLAANAELPAGRADEVRGHLSACSRCRERAEKLARAEADFVRAHREDLNRSLAPAGFARARLKAELAAASRGNRRTNGFHLAGMPGVRVWAYVCAAILLGVIGIRFVHSQAHSIISPAAEAGYSAGPLIPDANLTPGDAVPLTVTQVCAAGGLEEMRPPASVQQAVFHEYGMDGVPAQQYEVDHLITPALGGTEDIRNLWPESYSSEWNAHVKDELEDHLHALVCTGKLDLSTAQHDIATNWISAYRKYFHTDRPLPHNSDLLAGRDRPPAG